MKRIVIHSDLNNFFASVECLKKPWLKNTPMAVAGDVEERHGIILAKNIPAKAYGVKTGEVIWSAKQKCPSLITLPPNYEDYVIISKKVRKIYEEYTDCVESFGIDECWLDVSDIAKNFEEGQAIADEIRKKIRSQIGVTASCGVSFNKTFAKLASELKKPDATSVIDDKAFKECIWQLPVQDMLFVGRSTVRQLERLNIKTIGELANSDIKILELVLGKNGISLWMNANGKDSSPVTNIDIPSSIKSISNSITLPYDIITDEDVRVVLYSLCEKISSRLRRLDFICGTVQLYVRDNKLNSYERQIRLSSPNRTVAGLFDASFELYKINHNKGTPIRSLGVRATNLSVNTVEQLSIYSFGDRWQKYEYIDQTADIIRTRFGKASLKRGIMLTENVMTGMEINEEKCSFAKI